MVIGRQREVTPLEDPSAANRGEGQAVLVAGDAGMGKTRQAPAGPAEVVLTQETQRRVRGWLAGHGDGAAEMSLELKGFDRPVPAFRLGS